MDRCQASPEGKRLIGHNWQSQLLPGACLRIIFFLPTGLREEESGLVWEDDPISHSRLSAEHQSPTVIQKINTHMFYCVKNRKDLKHALEMPSFFSWYLTWVNTDSDGLRFTARQRPSPILTRPTRHSPTSSDCQSSVSGLLLPRNPNQTVY